MSNSLFVDIEVSIRIAKASAMMARLNKCMWSNRKLTVNTIHICQACILNTLLYSSESWTTYASQERTASTSVVLEVFCTLSCRTEYYYHQGVNQKGREHQKYAAC